MKRILIVILVLGATATAIWLLLGYFTRSSITINIEPELPAVTTSVLVDGRAITPTGSGGQTYVAQVGMGKHKIVVSSAGYGSKEESIDTGYRDSYEVSFELEKITASEVARDITSAINGVTVVDPRYFGEHNDWVVFYSAPPSGASDSLLVVAQFNPSANNWEIVAEGTEIDASGGQFDTAPQELVDYIEGIFR